MIIYDAPKRTNILWLKQYKSHIKSFLILRIYKNMLIIDNNGKIYNKDKLYWEKRFNI